MRLCTAQASPERPPPPTPLVRREPLAEVLAQPVVAPALGPPTAVLRRVRVALPVVSTTLNLSRRPLLVWTRSTRRRRGLEFPTQLPAAPRAPAEPVAIHGPSTALPTRDRKQSPQLKRCYWNPRIASQEVPPVTVLRQKDAREPRMNWTADSEWPCWAMLQQTTGPPLAVR